MNCFLPKKQVTVSSAINIWYVIFSKETAIDPRSFEKSSKFI